MPRWSDEELKELKDPDTWDLENLEPVAQTKAPRAVVSVAFNGTDFDRLSAAVEKSGKKLSTFIREAAMEKAEPRRSSVDVFSRTDQVFVQTADFGTVSGTVLVSHPSEFEGAPDL